MTVLIVDDDPDSRILLRRMVVWFGGHAHAARNARAALSWVKRRTPHLLLVDLRMRGMDGIALLKRLRAQARLRKVRAIAVTALGSDADIMRTWEAGFDGHLVKPIDLDTLAAALNRALWAQSGEVRFAVSQASTSTTGRPRTRTFKPGPYVRNPLA